VPEDAAHGDARRQLVDLVGVGLVDLGPRLWQGSPGRRRDERWIKTNNNIPYLPIGRQEYLLTRIFGYWWVEIKSVQSIANSVNVVVRLFVLNPITKEVQWQDGTGAQPMQTNSGKGAMEWNEIKNNAVQLASPAAESYAISDAAHKFGKIFGKDLGRKEQIDYNSLLKTVIDYDTLKALYDDLETDLLITPEIEIVALEIFKTKDESRYKKFYNSLLKLKK
jgi:hypothetical protein